MFHVPEFTGTNDTCCLCISDFEHHDRVLRLVCGHIFHVECWHGGTHGQLATCPHCRGAARILRHFLYIRYDPEEEHGNVESTSETVPAGTPQHGIDTPPTPDDFQTPQTTPGGSPAPGNRQMMLPWWIKDLHTSAYSVVTLPDGRLSIIVDPGAYTNLCGKVWARAQSRKAQNEGHRPKQEKMKQPLGVSGVGDGAQRCEWQAQVPIAIPGEYSDGQQTVVHTFESPIVEGSGENLPALLGLKSMASKNAILEMTPGKECLIFPGAGGYEIKLAPGYTRIPLLKAPSGHLVIPTDHFDTVASSSSGGLPSQHMTLHARLDE